MKKKSLITSLAVTAMLTSQTFPLSTFAAGNNEGNQQVPFPDRKILSSSLVNLGTQTVLLKMYALTLLKQPVIDIESIPNFSTQQAKTKQQANYWLNTVQPSLIDANQQLISFQQQFQNYYNKLIALSKKMDTDTQAKQDFISGITKLQTTLINYQSQINKMISNVHQFEKAFSIDAQNLITTANNIEKNLADQDGEILQLTKLITSLNGDIQSQIGSIVTGSITTLAGIVVIVLGTVALVTTANPAVFPLCMGITTATGGVVGGSVAIGLAAKKLNDKQEELHNITRKLTDAKANAVLLTLLKGQVTSFKDTILHGKASLESFNESWVELEQNFTDLKNSVNTIHPNSSIIEHRLTEIKNSVDGLATQAKEQEKMFTDISYQ